MPVVTPSRLAIIAVAFSLLTFLWTFGLPVQSGQPEVPVIDHYEHKNVHTDPIIPPPALDGLPDFEIKGTDTLRSLERVPPLLISSVPR